MKIDSLCEKIVVGELTRSHLGCCGRGALHITILIENMRREG